MVVAIEDSAELQFARRWHGFLEIFDSNPDATNNWTKTGEGTAAVTDGVGNGLTLTPSTGTVDNDEVYLERKFETFKYAASRPFYCEVELDYAQAATNAGNLLIGFMDAVGANALQDDGAGPKASYSGAVFFAIDGNLNWHVEVSIAGTQTTKELTAANSLDKSAHAAGSSSTQTLRIECVPKANSLADISFLIDGVVVYKIMDLDFSSATDMQFVIGAKNGSTANEVPKFRYAAAYQRE